MTVHCTTLGGIIHNVPCVDGTPGPVELEAAGEVLMLPGTRLALGAHLNCYSETSHPKGGQPRRKRHHGRWRCRLAAVGSPLGLGQGVAGSYWNLLHPAWKKILLPDLSQTGLTAAPSSELLALLQVRGPLPIPAHPASLERKKGSRLFSPILPPSCPALALQCSFSRWATPAPGHPGPLGTPSQMLPVLPVTTAVLPCVFSCVCFAFMI